MNDANRYRISLQRKRTEDGLMFEATVAELPDVAVYSDSAVTAYSHAIDVIESLRDLAAEEGRTFPKPEVRETDYSGKFLVRVPKSLHRELSATAKTEGVSLNQYLLSVLSCHKTLWHQQQMTPVTRKLSREMGHVIIFDAGTVSGSDVGAALLEAEDTPTAGPGSPVSYDYKFGAVQ